MSATDSASREGSDREITSELVHTAAWDVVLEVVAGRAKSIKTRLFSATTTDEVMQARFAFGELKTLVYAIYTKAGEKAPPNVASIFE